jgi:hypothetical protein
MCGPVGCDGDDVTEQEQTAIELLLSEPEIVAWLGTDETVEGRARTAQGGVQRAFEDALERIAAGSEIT